MQHNSMRFVLAYLHACRRVGLTQSRFFGTLHRALALPGLLATETSYTQSESLPAHGHEHPYFAYVISGQYSERAGSIARECERGAVVFHPPGEVHGNQMGPDGAQCFNVEFVADPWTGLLDGSSKPASVHAITFTGDVEWTAFRIWREFHRPDATSPLAVGELLVSLIAAVSRKSDCSSTSKGQWIDRAAEYVASHLFPSPRLEVVAAIVNVHPVHLARTFRKHYGCSMGEFARRRRIAWACAQLDREGATISSIAMDAGFSDHAHFTRTFRRITGCTPRWYRQHLIARNSTRVPR